MSHTFLIAAFAILGANIVIAQDKSEWPSDPLPMLKDSNISVPDTGFKLHRSRTRTSYEILANALPAHMNNSICSKKIADGTTTYDIIHDGKPLAIVFNEDGKLEVKMIRRYNRDNIEQLNLEYPELGEQLSAIPKAVGGNPIVAISLDIEITVTAKNADELKTNHPDLYSIFARYIKPPLVVQSKTLKVIEEPK